MSDERPRSLRDVLSDAVDWINLPVAQAGDRTRGPADVALTTGQRREFDQMISSALKSGLVECAVAGTPSFQRYSDGATAMLVCSATLALEFVVKWQEDPKILREAAYLQEVASRSDIPQRVRDRVPRVFAVHRGADRHAYLMERFPSPPYATLASRLKQERHNGALCRRLISAAWDALFEMYEATVSGPDRPVLPDVRTIYIDRIAGRLAPAGSPDELRALVERPLRVRAGDRDKSMPSCQTMIDELRRSWPALAASLTPSFVTMVLGDPHPGNILLHLEHAGSAVVKFIDPKEWGQGDYLFDIAKFLHYVEVTWLVEDLEPPEVTMSDAGATVDLSYRFNAPDWLGHARDDAFDRIRAFLSAGRRDDLWELRLSLGMASNLLGVAGSRYMNPKASPNARRAIFAEGAMALHDFLERSRAFVGPTT
jgi:hypothetical protein